MRKLVIGITLMASLFLAGCQGSSGGGGGGSGYMTQIYSGHSSTVQVGHSLASNSYLT